MCVTKYLPTFATSLRLSADWAVRDLTTNRSMLSRLFFHEPGADASLGQ
jgi:hypothetical protein